MSEMIHVCDLSSLDDPGARGVELADGAGREVTAVVVRRGDEVFAYVDSCPHTGVGLAWLPDRYLDVEGTYLQCATHGALFTLDGGYCVRGPCAGASLTPLAAALDGDRVLVRPPGPVA